MKKILFLLFILIAFTFECIYAQKVPNDTLFRKAKMADTAQVIKVIPDTNIYKTKILRSSVAPALLIAYGLTTLKNHGLYSSVQAKADFGKAFGVNRNTNIDNVMVFTPYIELGALLIAKFECKNDLLNTGLIILKANLLMYAIVLPLKTITKEERPDGSDNQSMPSAHTAEAFLAASVVYRETRYKTKWYGVGAYALASAVGFFRMYSDKHWESDVFVGAGIGMLCANITYATHQHRWGRNNVCFVPMYDGVNKGLLMALNF